MPRQTAIQRYHAALGRLGGAARAKALTPKRRQDIASHAAKTRWAKWREARANGGPR